MVHRGDADAMLCGTVGRFHQHLKHVDDIIGKADGIHALLDPYRLDSSQRHIFHL